MLGDTDWRMASEGIHSLHSNSNSVIPSLVDRHLWEWGWGQRDRERQLKCKACELPSVALAQSEANKPHCL